MILHESAKDYLEAVPMLREKKALSTRPMTEKFGVANPSVSYATGHLRKYGSMDDGGLIFL